MVLTPKRVAWYTTIFDHSIADFQRVALSGPIGFLFVKVGVDSELLRANKSNVIVVEYVVRINRVTRKVSGAARSRRVFSVWRFDQAGLRGLGRGRDVVLADTQLIRLAVFREFRTLQIVRPIDLKTVHDGLATVARGHAQRPARRQWPLHYRAHRYKNAAQEELQIVRTLDLHQRNVLLDFESRVVLLLAEQVGHDRFVVRYAQAERYRDGFASAIVATDRVVADHRTLLELLSGRMGRGHRDDDREQHRPDRIRSANVTAFVRRWHRSPCSVVFTANPGRTRTDRRRRSSFDEGDIRCRSDDTHTNYETRTIQILHVRLGRFRSNTGRTTSDFERRETNALFNAVVNDGNLFTKKKRKKNES